MYKIIWLGFIKWNVFTFSGISTSIFCLCCRCQHYHCESKGRNGKGCLNNHSLALVKYFGLELLLGDPLWYHEESEHLSFPRLVRWLFEDPYLVPRESKPLLFFTSSIMIPYYLVIYPHFQGEKK